MSEPFDASELRGWMQQVEYWLGDYRSGKDRKAEALQLASVSLALLVSSANSLSAAVRERLGVE